ncbi:MAG: hypothetical protein JRG83_02050, partial [Deltaproteobacteria bacterium]|nr:hypothetical protein [Deltaproteobacteria bacterium]
AVAMQRAMLERIGRRIEPAPLLWRMLPSGHLRLFFPVTGASDAIEKGTVVALVLLYDLAEERPLYAHPVHAGPGANPLLQHLSGPMAHPKAQEGGNGERATLRLLEHKRTLWERFEHEREELGPEEAGRLWRERYGWSLVRLYFCERCAACRFGSPFLEGSDGEPFRSTGSAVPEEARELQPGESSQIAAAVRASEPWRIEVAYAQRGGFTVRDEPSRVEALGADWRIVLFPTDAEWIEGGTLVGAIAYFHVPSGETRYASCLSAGPEAETLFLRGDTALGLPLTDAAARGAYAAWRAQAWSSFWLDELELGLHAASRRWLHGYWDALGRLFGAGSAPVREGRSAD